MKLRTKLIALALAGLLALAACVLLALLAPWRLIALLLLVMVLAAFAAGVLLLRHYTVRSVIDDRRGPRGYLAQLRTATRELRLATNELDERLERIERKLDQRGES